MNGGIESTILRLSRENAELIRILTDVYREIEDNYDVVDGDYGQPRPNRWMRIGMELASEVRQKIGIDITKGQ